MTLDEIKAYFGNGYQFQKKTGMGHSNYNTWERQGFIPLKTQVKLQKLSKGVLKIDLKDLGLSDD